MPWHELKKYAMGPGFTSSEWFVSKNLPLILILLNDFSDKNQERVRLLIERLGMSDATTVRGIPWSLLKWEVMDPVLLQKDADFDIEDVSFDKT